MSNSKKILVGLSGGVDSATCAALLKKQGYEVIGATMSIWGNKKVSQNAKTNKPTHGACLGPDEKEDIEAAKKISEFLKIPFHLIDLSREYDQIVLKYFKDEYLQGRTPNPCIRCNSLIKFNLLPLIAREKGIQFDKFATGHYARVEEKNGIFYLKKAKDTLKDQSYFLYKLTQEQLKNIMLPLGEYTKVQTREMAANFGLDVSDKPDSQDFYEGDYNELLGVGEKDGNIVDVNGKILGTHKGIWNFTVGQRKGIGISSKEPLYVIRLDKDTNTVIVGPIDQTFKKGLIAIDVNYPSGIKVENGRYEAKIRSSSKPQGCSVVCQDDGSLKIEFDEYQKSIALGQSAVIYSGDTLIAGGIIGQVF